MSSATDLTYYRVFRTVIVRGTVVAAGPRQPLTSAQLSAENAALHVQIAKQAKRIAMLENQLVESTRQQNVESTSVNESAESDTIDLLSTVLEALGLTQPKAQAGVEDPPAPWSPPWAEASPANSTSVLHRVPFERSRNLVEASLKFTSWHHSTVHAPTFLQAHDEWLASVSLGHSKACNDFLALCAATFTHCRCFYVG